MIFLCKPVAWNTPVNMRIKPPYVQKIWMKRPIGVLGTKALESISHVQPHSASGILRVLHWHAFVPPAFEIWSTIPFVWVARFVHVPFEAAQEVYRGLCEF